MPERNPGLDRLTGGERDCLRLLATGHDIKSLAAALDISESAATERLRSARARLGTTSSREAARLLAADEGVPQKIGASFSGVTNAAEGVQPEPARPATGAFRLMIPLALAAAAGAALAWHAAADRLPAAPRVVATVPAQGAIIAPGPFTLSVTFDRAMQPGGWSFVNTGQALYPACDHRPVQSADGRSFAMRCTASAPGAYVAAFNTGRFRNFRAAQDGAPAAPALLRFTVR